jgi:hypothetical protein
MDDRALLAAPHLTIVSGEPDFELRRIEQVIEHRATVDGRSDLERLLGRLLAAAESSQVAPKTLDLVGHTRSSASLITLGDWVLDAASSTVTAFFRELADHDVLPRLGVHALRLLGCNSAGSDHGRATICRLSELLGLEVYGASQLLYAGHWGPEGFRDCWRFLLTSSRDLRCGCASTVAAPIGAPYPRNFDIDALPASSLAALAEHRPLRIASVAAARQILKLVRRAEGASMPGLLTAPICELALPAAAPGEYHIAHVLLGGAFLRFYPDGMAASGIVYPVDDASALCSIVAGLAPVFWLTR